MAELIPGVKPSVPFKDQFTEIVLTQDEIDYALFEVRKKKDAINRENAYWEKVRQADKPIILTSYQLCDYIIKKAKERGANFVVDDHNKKIVELLCLYFTNDPAFETAGYSLKKGILIQGGVGCGKTTLMRLLMENQKQSYFISRCNDIASAFSLGGYKGKDGNDGIDKYFHPMKYTRDVFGFVSRGFCFDDLGTERNKKHYGNEANVMEEIILGWYDKFETRPERIHITTNLTADDITEMYGTRVRSRMREMFNILTFDQKAPDRRK